MKKKKRELSEDSIKTIDKYMTIDFWRNGNGGGTLPNLLYRSNYFICAKSTYAGRFTPFEVYNDPGKDTILKIGYKGFRGTIFDAKLIYCMQNLAKGKVNTEISVPEIDLVTGMGYHPYDPTARIAIRQRFENLGETLFKIIYKESYVIFLLLGNTAYEKVEDERNKAYYTYKIPEELGFLLEWQYSFVDNHVLDLVRNSDIETRIYFYLATNTKNPFIKTDNLISMVNPFSTNKEKLLKNIKSRTLPSLQEKGIIYGWEYKNDNRNMIEFKFINNSLTQVKKRIKNQSGGIMLRKRNPETIQKMEKSGIAKNIKEKLKQQKIEEKEKVVIKSRKKDQVEEIINYWEGLGRPRFKCKNGNNKSFKEAVKCTTRALEGRLYKKTKWEEYNQVFDIEGIKEAIQEFDKKAKNIPDSFMAKASLYHFFIPNPYLKSEKNPFLLDFYPKEDSVIKPICSFTYKYAVNRYKTRSKKKEINKQEQHYLILLVNLVEKEALHPFYVKQIAYEEALEGKESLPCRHSPRNKIKVASYVHGENWDYIFEIAFDLIFNYKEEHMPNQEMNDLGLEIVNQKNFIKKISQRINWVRALLRNGTGHPKYSSIPAKTFKSFT